MENELDELLSILLRKYEGSRDPADAIRIANTLLRSFHKKTTVGTPAFMTVVRVHPSHLISWHNEAQYAEAAFESDDGWTDRLLFHVDIMNFEDSFDAINELFQLIIEQAKKEGFEYVLFEKNLHLSEEDI